MKYIVKMFIPSKLIKFNRSFQTLSYNKLNHLFCPLLNLPTQPFSDLTITKRSHTNTYYFVPTHAKIFTCIVRHHYYNTKQRVLLTSSSSSTSTCSQRSPFSVLSTNFCPIFKDMTSPSPPVKKLRTASKIVTHSGQFHADEALAIAMLRVLPQFEDATIVRTRDPAIWSSPDVEIVVDVSAKYDGIKYFDHHQRDFSDTLSELGFTTKLSSAGLVYRHFGREVIRTLVKAETAQDPSMPVADDEEDMLDKVYYKVYQGFIEAIDANDNGIAVFDKDTLDTVGVSPRYSDSGISLPAFVATLNPRNDESDPDGLLADTQFKVASDFLSAAFRGNVLAAALSWYPALVQVRNVYTDDATRLLHDPKGRILIFNSSMPWKQILADLEAKEPVLDQVLYVIFPGSSPEDWRIQAVEKATFVSRKALPEPWRGLRDADLEKESGVPGSFFIHSSGFIGGNKTKEGAIKLAQIACDF